MSKMGRLNARNMGSRAPKPATCTPFQSLAPSRSAGQLHVNRYMPEKENQIAFHSGIAGHNVPEYKHYALPVSPIGGSMAWPQMNMQTHDCSAATHKPFCPPRASSCSPTTVPFTPSPHAVVTPLPLSSKRLSAKPLVPNLLRGPPSPEATPELNHAATDAQSLSKSPISPVDHSMPPRDGAVSSTKPNACPTSMPALAPPCVSAGPPSHDTTGAEFRKPRPQRPKQGLSKRSVPSAPGKKKQKQGSLQNWLGGSQSPQVSRPLPRHSPDSPQKVHLHKSGFPAPRRTHDGSCILQADMHESAALKSQENVTGPHFPLCHYAVSTSAAVESVSPDTVAATSVDDFATNCGICIHGRSGCPGHHPQSFECGQFGLLVTASEWATAFSVSA